MTTGDSEANSEPCVGVLGPLDVRDCDGNPVVITSRRERALLEWLAVRAPETVSLPSLIDILWPDNPPSSATQTTQTLVYRLRKRLGRDVIVTDGRGYRLGTPPENLDLWWVAERTRVGLRLLRAGHRPAAHAALQDAVGLWRGAPLADLEPSPWTEAETRRLDEQHEQLVDTLHDVQLDLGAAGDLIGELSRLTARAPLNEKRWSQLLLALYRAGRQADALDAYQRARSELIGQLGIEPGQALRRLEAQILAHDPALDVPTSPPATPPPDTHAIALPVPSHAPVGFCGRSTAVPRSPGQRSTTRPCAGHHR